MLKRLVLGEIDVDRVANYIGGCWMKRNELKEYVKKHLVNLIVSVTKLPEENVLPNLSF